MTARTRCWALSKSGRLGFSGWERRLPPSIRAFGVMRWSCMCRCRQARPLYCTRNRATALSRSLLSDCGGELRLTRRSFAALRRRLTDFRQESERQLEAFDVLLLPCCPTPELRAGEDHSRARLRILRYTTPISLLGWPAVTLPTRRGGPQLVGKLGSDAQLLALSAAIAD